MVVVRAGVDHDLDYGKLSASCEVMLIVFNAPWLVFFRDLPL